MSESQDQFSYEESTSDALEAAISAERLSTFLIASDHQKEDAIRLYLWNIRVSEAFHLPLQTIEITLRNSINKVLVRVYGPDWPIDTRLRAVMKPNLVESLDKTTRRIQRSGRNVTTGRIVAGLSFDFWTSLLQNELDRPLWQANLARAFPNMGRSESRRTLLTRMIRVKDLRNRVAHYEPVIGEDLSGIHSNILDLIAFQCAATAAWVRHHSNVQALLRQRPRPAPAKR